MGGPDPARKVALELISQRRRRGAHMRELLRSSASLSHLESRDRALAVRFALGVTSTEGALDTFIEAHLRGGSHLEPRVRDALRLSCYEICWLSTPIAVAVNQGVELVRSVAPRAAGLANAVLRHVASEDAPQVLAAKRRLTSSTSDLVAKDVSLAAGIPAWLAYQLLSCRGPDICRQMALAQTEPAPVYVAANAASLSEKEALRRMEEVCLNPEPTVLPGSWVLRNPGRLASSGMVGNAVMVPCDLAVQIISWLGAPSPGRRMLEVGQGRGTKTILFELRALAEGGFAEITSIDSESFKVRIASSRMAVAGISGHVNSLVFDGRALSRATLPPVLAGGFDTVFVDAPCSGTGTMRRHPEIAWALERSSLNGGRADGLPRLQLDLLRGASARVRPHGELFYATCSMLAQEDEDVVDEFLASEEGQDFELASILDVDRLDLLTDEAYGLISDNTTDEGFFLSHPMVGSFDGHFCARFVRVE